jgi:hypothetical protein
MFSSRLEGKMKEICLALLLLATVVMTERVDAAQFNPADCVTSDGSHTVVIRRIYDGSDQAKLILAAESAVPKREDVIRAMRDSGKEALEAAPCEHPWWSATFDKVFVPYAITAEAVSYYTDLSEAFRKGDFSGANGIKMQKSDLVYVAIVTQQRCFEYEDKEFENVSVVTMDLWWNQYCGSECAMDFRKKRVVVFDQDGNVLHIFHDGKTLYAVS